MNEEHFKTILEKVFRAIEKKRNKMEEHTQVSEVNKVATVIDLYGAPSSGKSTTLLGLAYAMKMMGLSVEINLEFFKELVVADAQKVEYGGQLYVLSEQNRRLAPQVTKSDFVITDCPLPLIGYYTKPDYIEGFHEMVTNLYNKYNNVGYLIERKHAFEDEKRDHDEAQAAQIAREIPQYLEKHGIGYKAMDSGKDLVDRILEDLIASNVITLEHLQKSRDPEIRAKYRPKM
jgi:RecA/RadA recombinase